jgi:hypothetical protein
MKRLNRNKKAHKSRTLKRNHSQVLRNVAVAFIIVAVAIFAYVKLEPHTHDAKVRTELESKSHQLLDTKQQLEQTKARDAETQKKLDELNKQLEDTKKQLEAKRNTPVVYAAPAPKATGVTNCGDNPYKQFIYQHESGCRTNAVNEIGACGLGQALPCGKMGCGLSDWACQDRYFTNYAVQRYGSWEAAYSFWRTNSWW